MTLGLECIKFMLEQDPANLPIVQQLDRQVVLARLPRADAGRHDDGLHAAQARDELEGSLGDLRRAERRRAVQRPGPLRHPRAQVAGRRPATTRTTSSHQAWATFYQYGAAAAFHTWMPSDDEMDWLSEKYPNTFDKYYRPRFEYWARAGRGGQPLLQQRRCRMLCQTCQIPMLFTEPGDPTKICYRETRLQGREVPLLLRRLQGDLRQRAGEVRPGLAAGAPDLPGQLLQPEGADPTAPGFDPLLAVLEYYHMNDRPRQLRLRGLGGPEELRRLARHGHQATKDDEETSTWPSYAIETLRVRPPRTRVENFHGNQLLYIGWEDHLMFCAPVLPSRCRRTCPSAHCSSVLPGTYGYHPDFAKIDWTHGRVAQVAASPGSPTRPSRWPKTACGTRT